jgi:hypothetical protein
MGSLKQSVLNRACIMGSNNVLSRHGGAHDKLVANDVGPMRTHQKGTPQDVCGDDRDVLMTLLPLELPDRRGLGMHLVKIIDNVASRSLTILLPFCRAARLTNTHWFLGILTAELTLTRD